MRDSVEVTIEYYVDEKGRRPYFDWFNSLDRAAAEIVAFAVEKRRIGIIGNSRSVGGGVHELKAGKFRIYYGVHGDKLIILLAGGTKRRQQDDIDVAKSRWRNVKQEPRKWAKER